MSLDGNQLVALLGHASVASPLDDFLTQHGIKVRPKGNSGSYLLSDGPQGVDFEYKESDDFDEIALAAAPSSGKFNLLSVEFNANAGKKRQPFSGHLPFSLNFSMTPEDVAALLGQPKDFLGGSESQGSVSIYLAGDRLVTIGRAVGDRTISWVRVGVLTVDDRQSGYLDG